MCEIIHCRFVPESTIIIQKYLEHRALDAKLPGILEPTVMAHEYNLDPAALDSKMPGSGRH